MPDCHGCARGRMDKAVLDLEGRRRFMCRTVPAMIVAVAGAVGLSAQADGERTFPIPDADRVVLDQESEIILVRRANLVFAFARACPHERAQLRWRNGDARFQCPRHESKYQMDGTLISGRATRNMDRLPIRRDGPAVVVDSSRPIRSDRQPAEWASAVVTL